MRSARRLLGFALPLAAASVAVAAAPAGAEAQQRVTIFARPAVVAWAQPATLYGAADNAGPTDLVVVEARECGSSFFRTFVEVHPGVTGGWSTPAGTGITTTYRAVSKGATSALVTIRQRARVVLERRRSGNGFLVAATSRRSLWRARVEIQRRRSGGWRTIKTVALADSVGSTGRVSVSQAVFGLNVPRGTLLRAVLPAASAKPCYAQSASRPVRA